MISCTLFHSLPHIQYVFVHPPQSDRHGQNYPERSLCVQSACWHIYGRIAGRTIATNCSVKSSASHSNTHPQVQVALKVIRSGASNGAKDLERHDRVSPTGPRHTYSVPTCLQNLLREAELLSQLDHPNIAAFYGICDNPLGRTPAPCLVGPYFKNGNVKTYLEQNVNVNRIKMVRSPRNEICND